VTVACRWHFCLKNFANGITALSAPKTSCKLCLHIRENITILRFDFFPIEMRGDQLPVSATGPRFVLQLLFGDKSQNCQKFIKAREKIGTALES